MSDVGGGGIPPRGFQQANWAQDLARARRDTTRGTSHNSTASDEQGTFPETAGQTQENPSDQPEQQTAEQLQRQKQAQNQPQNQAKSERQNLKQLTRAAAKTSKHPATLALAAATNAPLVGSIVSEIMLRMLFFSRAINAIIMLATIPLIVPFFYYFPVYLVSCIILEFAIHRKKPFDIIIYIIQVPRVIVDDMRRVLSPLR